MADYHIYLHSETSSGISNKTKPYQNKDEDDGSGVVFSKAFTTTKGVMSGNGVNMGVSAITKVVPWAAAVVATVKITDKVLTTGFAEMEEFTGNYENNVNYNNFKTALHVALHPIQTSISITRKQMVFDKQNVAIRQQNTLVGNSILKNFNVGV